MDKEIQINYTPNVDTSMKVSKYLLLRFFRFVPFIVGFIALSLFLPRLISEQETLELKEFLPLILMVVVMVVIYFRSFSAMRKNFLSNKRNLEPQKITFTTNSYVQQAETFRLESFWNETLQIRETKDWFLIYPRKNSAFPIVKSDLSAKQYQELKTLFSSLPIKKSLK